MLRFKSVLKSWNAIICDDEFKKTHYEQSKALGRKKLLSQKFTGHLEFRDLGSPQLIVTEKQRFPLKRFRFDQVFCSCNGLVLLKNHNAYKRFVLWNPSTREYQTFACPYLNHNDTQRPYACGLCYDSRFNDCKVILIYNSFYAVCSLNNDSWTKKTSFPCALPFSDYCYPGISTEDCVFWFMTSV